MATARAVYEWDANASVRVEVTADESFPDAIAEVTTACRRLLRDTTADMDAMARERADG